MRLAMTINYDNTPEDALNFYACWMRNTRTGQDYLRRVRILRAVCLIVLPPLVCLLLSVTSPITFSLPAALVTSILFGIAGYVMGNSDFKRMVGRITRQQVRTGALTVFLGPKQMSVTPEGLRVVWADGEALRKWSAFRRTEENATHLMLIFGESDFTAIPKRAFRDAAHQQEFLAAVERYSTGAGAITANGTSPIAASTSTSAPWWRNRSAVDATEDKAIQQRRF